MVHNRAAHYQPTNAQPVSEQQQPSCQLPLVSLLRTDLERRVSRAEGSCLLPELKMKFIFLFLCCYCEQINLADVLTFLFQVFGHIQKEGLQVTILSTCPVADYKTQESTLTLPSPFLKALKTKEFKEQVCCPLLEQPNIVRDLPAAGILQSHFFTVLLVAI